MQFTKKRKHSLYHLTVTSTVKNKTIIITIIIITSNIYKRVNFVSAISTIINKSSVLKIKENKISNITIKQGRSSVSELFSDELFSE